MIGHGNKYSVLVTLLAFAAPVFFILVPLVIFLGYSFFSVDHGEINYTLTTANYVRFFTDPVFLPVFWNTCLLCLSVSIICVLLGYPAAYFLTTLNGRWRYIMLMLLLVPLLMSYV
ncbi:MAG: ABC transporter permease, partial [Rhizobiaceae bacterium]|nr:ABC transporter permease [Rhizobiaceae bacterium]